MQLNSLAVYCDDFLFYLTAFSGWKIEKIKVYPKNN